MTPPLLKTGGVDPPTFCDAEYAFLAFMSVKQASATPTNTSDSESLQELPKANRVGTYLHALYVLVK